MMDIRQELAKPHVQLLVLLGTLALVLISLQLFQNSGFPLNQLYIVFGILIVVEIGWFVAAEIKDGAKKYGWKHEVIDTVIALAVAVALWYGASFLLNTSAPISAVVSCSMLPDLQRGDFVIVQGAPVKAYEIEMSETEFRSLTNPSEITYDGNKATVGGSLMSYCDPSSNRSGEMCDTFRAHPELFVEEKGPFRYRYESCDVALSDGSEGYMPCLKSVSFHGVEYLTDFSNDIIVYSPMPTEPYAVIGDIVHRVLFKIDVDGETYYLTRGDNNPLMDLQVYDYGRGMGNLPISEEQVRGKVIGRIPLLGYFKLFIHGYFTEYEQCKTQLRYTSVPAS